MRFCVSVLFPINDSRRETQKKRARRETGRKNFTFLPGLGKLLVLGDVMVEVDVMVGLVVEMQQVVQKTASF